MVCFRTKGGTIESVLVADKPEDNVRNSEQWGGMFVCGSRDTYGHKVYVAV